MISIVFIGNSIKVNHEEILTVIKLIKLIKNNDKR